MCPQFAPPKLRWGLLSTARINRALIPPIRRSKQSELVAVASRSTQKAQAYADEWGIPKAYGSYADMLADPEIDVIYNSLPNSMHSEWSIRAMEAGKHVLCEKPLCLSNAELDHMAAVSQKTGKVVTEAFMYRHHPQTLKVKEIVNNGALGELRFIRGTFSFKLNRPQDPRLDPGMGGGSIWDVGCYPISYARWITGCEPEEVFGWQLSSRNGIDLFFSGQMRFPSGVIAQFDSSFDVPYRVSMEIVGTQGTLSISRPFSPSRKGKLVLNKDDHHEVITTESQDLYLGEVIDMENVALHAQAPLISLQDSRGNLLAITALLQSAKTGTPVFLKQS